MKKVCLLLFVFCAVACKYNDPQLSVAEILVRPANGWVRTSIVITIPGSAVDIEIVTNPDLYRDCDKDDATVFLSNRTYRVESTVKCDPSESATLTTGTWSLSSDEKTLVTTIGGVPSLGDIYELGEDRFVIRLNLTVDGITRSAVVTMRPKT